MQGFSANAFPVALYEVLAEKERRMYSYLCFRRSSGQGLSTFNIYCKGYRGIELHLHVLGEATHDVSCLEGLLTVDCTVPGSSIITIERGIRQELRAL